MRRGTIHRRKNGTYVLEIDLGKQQCQQCQRCRRPRHWATDGVLAACPKCRGELGHMVARRRERHNFTSAREAERARAKLLHAKDEGTLVITRLWTVGEYLTRWLDTLDVTDLKESTKDSYRRNIEKHVVPRIGHVRLQQLAPDDLSRLYAALLRGGLSRRTVHYIHTIVSKALRAGVDAGHLARNPAEKATRPQRKSDRGHKGRTWNELELRTFLAYVADDPFYPAFVLAATTGMRRGEVLGLTWRDVDLEHGRVSVYQQLVSIRYELRFENTTKTGEGRVVDLDDWTISALRTHRTRQKELRLRLGLGVQRPDDFVFIAVDKQGRLKPLHPETLMKTFKRRAHRAGVPVIRFHDLRHTWASLALRAGESPKVVQERLGHKSIQITLDIYSHVAPGMQKEAANNVAARIFGAF